MLIELDLVKLERHLSCLDEELREVQILCALMQARLMQPGTVPARMAEQLSYLENQQKWIKNRRHALEKALRYFSRIRHENDQLLSQSTLCCTDPCSLPDEGWHL